MLEHMNLFALRIEEEQYIIELVLKYFVTCEIDTIDGKRAAQRIIDV